MQPSTKTALSDSAYQRQMALSRWDNEGGAEPGIPQDDLSAGEARSENRQLTNTELVQLHVRVIALENLVIALLAESSDRQLDLARDMAAYISPRPGRTRHPMTLHAASQMIHLVERAGYFRGVTPCVEVP
jgi:hypothetical protein